MSEAAKFYRNHAEIDTDLLSDDQKLELLKGIATHNVNFAVFPDDWPDERCAAFAECIGRWLEAGEVPPDPSTFNQRGGQ